MGRERIPPTQLVVRSYPAYIAAVDGPRYESTNCVGWNSGRRWDRLCLGCA
jgi:hypothetical protein